MTHSVGMALLLSFLAGAATLIGAAIALVVKKEDFSFLAIGLGFSAGVMLYVGFMELLPQGTVMLSHQFSAGGRMWATVSFFAGACGAFLVDYLLPHHVEAKTWDKNARLERAGVFTAVVLTLHNIPEGLTTFMATWQDFTLGLSVTVAVAIHNIPEGIAVALPLYHATGNRKKAFLYSSLSGLTEPLGALAGFWLMRRWLHQAAVGVLFALVAGIMVYIALDELLPTAHEYGDGHRVMWSVLIGMAIMAASLLIFNS